jgi:hypothetical protein
VIRWTNRKLMPSRRKDYANVNATSRGKPGSTRQAARPRRSPEAQRLWEVYLATSSPENLAAYQKAMDDAHQHWMEERDRMLGPEMVKLLAGFPKARKNCGCIVSFEDDEHDEDSGPATPEN